MMISMGRMSAILALGCLAFLVLFATPARAQHSDWLLGTDGLLGGQQAPRGIYYSNIWSYYHASGNDFAETGPLKCGPRDRVCLGLNLGGNGSLEPILSLNRGSFALSSIQNSGQATKGSICNMYVEPINLGWHLRQLDAIVSSGFMAPAGPYNSTARLNMGYGHWTGVFGLGGVVYADAERTWSLSIYAHYLLYGSQMGRNYTLGDEVPFEWGTGKTFNLNNDIFKQVTLGAVGYAQWQVTNNQIDLIPTTKIGASALNAVEHASARIYSAGPAINLLTKYGLFSLRYYEEFGANATPSGRQLMFSVTIGK